MYITQYQLQGFDRYKYKSVDTSPLANYIMHPFWNQFVKMFPLWVAPNLMTFIGFLLLVVQTAILMYYDPYYTAADDAVLIPTWVWIFSAIAQFLSHTLDGIDGKQARRTNSSSPLGELFDHGLDSWSTSMFIFNVFTVFGRNLVPVNHMVAILLTTLFSFVLCHWEKYNTGVLYLPWAYDLSQVFLVLVYGVTAMYGTGVWNQNVFGFPMTFVFKVTLCVSNAGYAVPISCYNVYKARQLGTGKDRSIYEASLPLLSPLLSLFIVTSWFLYSPSDIFNSNPRLMMFAASVLFSNVTCRLIVAQMSDSRCQPLNSFVPFTLLCMLTAVTSGSASVELVLAWTCTSVLTLAHIHYGVVVVRSLADHFKIKVFSIKRMKRS